MLHLSYATLVYTFDSIYTCVSTYITCFRQQHVRIFLLQLQHGFIFLYFYQFSIFLSLSVSPCVHEFFVSFVDLCFMQAILFWGIKYILESIRVHKNRDRRSRTLIQYNQIRFEDRLITSNTLHIT